jgi:hypothetical protein
LYRRLKPGDYLLCYLSKVSLWVSILEVKSEPYLDNTRIWKEETYPCRVDVGVVAALAPTDGIPIKDLVDKLSHLSRAQMEPVLDGIPDFVERGCAGCRGSDQVSRFWLSHQRAMVRGCRNRGQPPTRPNLGLKNHNRTNHLTACSVGVAC